MIFITTGLQLPFPRLFKIIDKLIDDGIIENEVVCQGLKTEKYNSFELVEYLCDSDFNDNVDKASIVITHAGMGSILTLASKEKKFIIFPRSHQLGEHRNDHQMDIVPHLNEKGFNVATNQEELAYMLKNKNLSKPDVQLNSELFIKRFTDLLGSILD